MERNAPPVRDIVLVGAGHSHVAVLRRFGMRPAPGLRLTVIARETLTPYSGMLPGHVAGFYEQADIHIDVTHLARFAGARLIGHTASGLDPDAGQVFLEGRAPLRYDVLSINVGGLPGAGLATSDWLTPVKPIGAFLPRWQRVAKALVQRQLRIVVVGGGPGGVELALAIRARFPATANCVLATAEDELLARHPWRVRRLLARRLAARGVEVHTAFHAQTVDAARVQASDGRELKHDHVFWVTGVDAPDAFRNCGLATDEDGFIAVSQRLQSLSHPAVFAAGDAAAMVGQPRPKSGVYAVRQGPVLAQNLRQYALGRPLRSYRAQKHALALIGTADGRAVASRGRLWIHGRAVWQVKRWLDRRFVRRFQALPEMTPPPSPLLPELRSLAPDEMRCGGCGAKLGADLLARALARLPETADANMLQGIGDDAAVVRLEHSNVVLTCDGFRAMIDDPYRFGRIAARHALNDIFAMNASPRYALALATVPAMSDALMEEDLFQMMAGAVSVFSAEGVALAGGHSAEGAELSVGFTVAGVAGERLLAKGGLQVGQQLVLTKAIGVGATLAAAMRSRAGASQLAAAIDLMDTSNADAARILAEHGATACTDVTGFGLAGHLSEMTRASGVGATLWLRNIPCLRGAAGLLAAGIRSSLQENNERALVDYAANDAVRNAPEFLLLADPQTAGGLLAGVPADASAACVNALLAAGHSDSAAIGEVVASGLGVTPERKGSA